MDVGIDHRRVGFYEARTKQESRSRRFREDDHDHSFRFFSALSGISKGQTQQHREAGRKEGAMLGYTKVSDIQRFVDSTLLLIEHGSTRRTAPMIGSVARESEHVDLDEEQMPSWSAHVLLGHTPYPSGTIPILLERVPYLPKTAVENFLNHLLHATPECRKETDGYNIYFKVELSQRTEQTLGQFLSREGVPADFEVVVPDGRLDSNVDETFQVSYTKKSDTNNLSRVFQSVWPAVCGRDKAKVRLRSLYNGIQVVGEFSNLTEDYLSLRLGVNGRIDFEPVLENHHSEIHSHVRETLRRLLRDGVS